MCPFCCRPDCDADPCPALDRPHIARELRREAARLALFRGNRSATIAHLDNEARGEVARILDWARRQER